MALLFLMLLSPAIATASDSPNLNVQPDAVEDSSKAASESEQEIPVSEYRRLLVANPWLFSEWSGGKPQKRPGDVPTYIFTIKEDGTWTRKSLRQMRRGAPAMENGEWKLDGDRLRLMWQDRGDDPNEGGTTIKFLTPQLLKYGEISYWTAEVEQDE
jgi:hypothetical protein